MITRNKIILVFIILYLFISAVSADAVIKKELNKTDIIKDDSKKESKIIVDVPAEFKNKIAIAGGDTSYSVTKNSDYVKISKIEAVDTHTKTVCTFDISVIEALPGYNGKEFRVVRLVNGNIAGDRVIKTKDVLKGKAVVFDATFSDVIISGVVGSYTKTVSNVDMLNTSIPFDVDNASLLTINMSSPGTYQAWNQTNISTYPGTSGKWLIVLPFNGNGNDISGNAKHVTLYGTPAFGTGRNGLASNSIKFDGSDDYVGYEWTNTLYDNAEMVWMFNETTTAQGVIGEFREADGSGRTAMYNNENAVYLDNTTAQTHEWIEYTDGSWHWAFYPFTPAQIDYFQIGKRYASTPYYLNAHVDVAGLYNGTLSADDRRKFTYGYSGVTVAAYPNTTRTPITSASQSITTSGNITQVNVKSNTAGTKNITLTALFTHDYTKVNEYDNGTHRIVEILYTPTSNITTGHLNYTLASIEGLGAPSITSNDSSADVNLIGNILVIDVGTITEGVTKYYDVAMTSGNYTITDYTPLDTTPSKPSAGSITFNATASGDTAIEWYVNGTLAETDTGTTGNYTYAGSIAGDYEIKVMVGSDYQTWILTVLPEAVYDFSPDTLDLKIKNDSIQQFKVSYSEPCDIIWRVNNTTDYVTLDLPNVLPYGLNFYDDLTLYPGTSGNSQRPNILISDFNTTNPIIANVTISNCTTSTIFNFTINGLTEGTDYYFLNSSGIVTSNTAGALHTYFNFSGISNGDYSIAPMPVYDPEITITDFNASSSNVATINITNSSNAMRWNITLHGLTEGTRYYFLNDTGVATFSTAGAENTYINITGISDGIYYIKTNPSNGIVRYDYDTTISAYWYNASRIGIFNITAVTDSGQTSWTVNVTANPNSGSGDFVTDGIAIAIVVAAGYFWNKFRRRL